MSDAYISRVRHAVAQQQPDMLGLFDTVAGEARFARAWLAPNLAALPAGARLLEVGGGTFLLSCMLAEEGYAVTSIEPVGDGFGEFAALAKLILAESKYQLTIAACRAEDFSGKEFDFAFSVNVMEHVDDVGAVIASVTNALKPNAAYRFFCPNYLFPYEPHFNIPIIFTKDITQFLLHKKISEHTMPDPIGAWSSLNWIDVPTVRRIAAKHALALTFHKDIFLQQLARATRDEGFATRRGGLMIRLIKLFMALKLHRLIAMVPAIMQPTMDVTLRKEAA